MNRCSICSSKKTRIFFNLNGYEIRSCVSCNSQFLNPIPSKEILSKIYNDNYFIKPLQYKNSLFSKQKQNTADLHIKILKKFIKKENAKILEVGSGYGDFLHRAVIKGYDVTGVEYSKNSKKVIDKKFKNKKITVFDGELKNQNFKKKSFDIIVFFDVMEHVTDLNEFMIHVKKFLKKDGFVLLSVPSLDSLSAKVMKKSWMEYKIEHLHYFNNKSLKEFIDKSGFNILHISRDKKNLSLDYIHEHFRKYPIIGINFILKILSFILPGFLWKKDFNITASGVILLAQLK